MSWIPSYKKKMPPYVPCEWSTGTDAEIVEALNKHYAGEVDLHDYWAVGDERVVHLSDAASIYNQDYFVAQDITLVLTEAGGKNITSGPLDTVVGECAFQVDFKECLATITQYDTFGGTVAFNTPAYSSTAHTGWGRSTLGTWTYQNLLGMLPETLQTIFKRFEYGVSFSQYVSSSKRNNYVTTGHGTIAIRAIKELTGDTTVYDEGEQVEYYKTTANRIKYITNPKTSRSSTQDYWTRTMRNTNKPTSDYSYFYLYDTNDDTWRAVSAITGLGVSFFGVI